MGDLCHSSEEEGYPSRKSRMSKEKEIYGVFYEEGEYSKNVKDKGNKSIYFENSYSDEEEYPPRKGRTSKEEEIYEEDEYSKNVKGKSNKSINFVSKGNKINNEIRKRKAEDPGYEGKQRKIGKSSFGLKSNLGTTAIGVWEKHSKGIGSKLMGKMGYVIGGGIGKNLQGIATPIEAVVRKGKGAIGAHGHEKPQRPYKLDDDVSKSKSSSIDSNRNNSKHKKQFRSQPKKKYVTLEEMEDNDNSDDDVSPASINASNMLVVDMTGKQAKVFSGYENIGKNVGEVIQETSIPEIKEEEPEIIKNIRLLINTLEDEKFDMERKLMDEQDNLEALKSEVEKIEKKCLEEEENVSILEEIVDILDECREACENEPLASSLNTCLDLFPTLGSDFSEEIIEYNVLHEIMKFITPAVQKSFSNWDAHIHAMQGAQIMALLDEVLNHIPLSKDNDCKFVPGITQPLKPFEIILYEVVFPRLTYAVSTWDVRKPQIMFDIIQWWDVILPDWMLLMLVDDFIYKKIVASIESWKFEIEKSTLGSWLRPWLKKFVRKMVKISAVIHHRLASYLSSWVPVGGEVNIFLTDCLDLLTPMDQRVFVVKNILPKLIAQVKETPFCPQSSIYKPLLILLEWSDFIPRQTMMDTLKWHVLRKMNVTTQLWINSGSIDENEANRLKSNWASCIIKRLK